MIRPPSNQKHYDEFYSGDDAFIQPPPAPPKDADEEQRAAHAAAREAHQRKVKTARETGDWSELLVEGGQPTKFELRPLPGNVFRQIVDLAVSDAVGSMEANMLLVRAALVGVANLGKAEVKVALDPTYPKLGPIATNEVPNLLDRVSPLIVAELAGTIHARASGLSPL